MGSKPRDSGTMQSSSAGAQAADAALAASATKNQLFTDNARKSLFGSSDGSNLSGGTLSKFLDPNSLNVSGPTGTFGLQYNKAVENIANQSANARGSLSRYMASRGFGNAPAGFAADEARKQESDQVNQQGAAFTDFAGKSYQDALQNFWRASGSLSGEGDSALSAALSGDSAAANNYANLYGTASTPKPSVLGQVIGGGLQAGGSIGAAAAGKPGKPPVCWIAEVLYGVNDPRTNMVRRWLIDEYSRTITGAIVVFIYKTIGERVAAVVKRNRFARALVIPLFDKALKKAQAGL